MQPKLKIPPAQANSSLNTIYLRLIMVLFGVLVSSNCLATRPADLAFEQQDNPDEIKWHDINDRSINGTLVKYGTYKPRQALDQFKNFGDGLTIWVEAEKLNGASAEVHRQVNVFKENLEIMVTRSPLTQEIFFDLSNQSSINQTGKNAQFSVGFIVSTDPKLSWDPADNSDGAASPLNENEIRRAKLARNSDPGKGSASLISLDRETFEVILNHEAPPMQRLTRVTGAPANTPNLPSFEQLDITADDYDGELTSRDTSRLVVSDNPEEAFLVTLDPDNQDIKRVEFIEVENGWIAYNNRGTAFHETAHSRTILQGRMPPEVDKTISRVANILEEYENHKITNSPHKEKFTEWDYQNEQSRLVSGETRRGILRGQTFSYRDDDPLATLEKLKKKKPDEFLDWAKEGPVFSNEMRSYYARVGYGDGLDVTWQRFLARLKALEEAC